MPGKDGKGPLGGGGPGSGRRGTGRREGAGPGGKCLCPKCGAEAPHKAGVPCAEMVCPRCGAVMVRE